MREGRLSPSAPVSDPQSLQKQKADPMTAVPSRKSKRWSEGFWKPDPSDHNLQLCSVQIALPRTWWSCQPPLKPHSGPTSQPYSVPRRKGGGGTTSEDAASSGCLQESKGSSEDHVMSAPPLPSVHTSPLLQPSKEGAPRDFPGGPVVKTPSCQCKRHGFHP